MAKKRFYLVKRKDKLTQGKPTYYCRFRDTSGTLLPWKSTGLTAKTTAENWALLEMPKTEAAKLQPEVTLAMFAADFVIPGKCSWLRPQAAKGRPLSDAWARAKRQMLANHVLPALGSTRLDRLTRPT